MTLFLTAAAATAQPATPDEDLHVIELRNYTVVKGQRDRFQRFMETVIIPQQQSQRGYVLQQFHLDGSDTSYIWMRGFSDMPARSQFLKDFYNSAYWKQHRDETNSMLTNIEYIYLLKPLTIRGLEIDSVSPIKRSEWIKKRGIAVIDFYETSGKRTELIELFAHKFLSLQKKCGVKDLQLWIGEMGNNDFWLPSIQDPDLLVSIRFFPNRETFERVQHEIDKNSDVAHEMSKIVSKSIRQIVWN